MAQIEPKKDPYAFYMQGATVDMFVKETGYSKDRSIELFTKWDNMNNEPKPTLSAFWLVLYEWNNEVILINQIKLY